MAPGFTSDMKTNFILSNTLIVLLLTSCLSLDSNRIKIRTDREQMDFIEYRFLDKFDSIVYMSPLYFFPDELIRPYYSVLMNRIKNKELTPNYQSALFQGVTPLMLASYLNDLEGMDFLLQNGADPNKIDKDDKYFGANDPHCGLTALHFAAIRNHSEAYRKLLEHGASENIRDRYGYTPKNVNNQDTRCLYAEYSFGENFEIVKKNENM